MNDSAIQKAIEDRQGELRRLEKLRDEALLHLSHIEQSITRKEKAVINLSLIAARGRVVSAPPSASSLMIVSELVQ